MHAKETWGGGEGGGVGGGTVASWISIQLLQSEGIKGSTEVRWPSKMVPRSLLYLNRQPKIRENRKPARRTSLALRIRGGGPVVLWQTAS